MFIFFTETNMQQQTEQAQQQQQQQHPLDHPIPHVTIDPKTINYDKPLTTQQVIASISNWTLTKPTVSKETMIRTSYIQMIPNSNKTVRVQMTSDDINDTMIALFGVSEPPKDETTGQYKNNANPRKWAVVLTVNDAYKFASCLVIDKMVCNILSRNSKDHEWDVNKGKKFYNIYDVYDDHYSPIVSRYQNPLKPEKVYEWTMKANVVVMTPDDEDKFDKMIAKYRNPALPGEPLSAIENRMAKMAPKEKFEYDKFMRMYTNFYLYKGMTQDGKVRVVRLSPKWSEIRSMFTQERIHVKPVIQYVGVFWTKKIIVSRKVTDMILIPQHRNVKGEFADGSNIEICEQMDLDEDDNPMGAKSVPKHETMQPPSMNHSHQNKTQATLDPPFEEQDPDTNMADDEPI